RTGSYILHILIRKLHLCEFFRHVCIEYAVFIPTPGRLRLRQRSRHLDFFKAPKENIPYVTFLRWKWTTVCQPVHSIPWEGDFHRPTGVNHGTIVDHTVYVHSRLHPRKIPIGESPADAAWMCAAPKTPSTAIIIAAKRQSLTRDQVKFRDVEPASALICILPDKE